MSTIRTFREAARDILVVRDVDVIVVGGGPAGLAAAISSARCGAQTLLVERFGYLGGTATASLMACINGFRNQVEPDFTPRDMNIDLLQETLIAQGAELRR